MLEKVMDLVTRCWRSSGLLVSLLFQVGVRPGIGYIRLIFDDLDLPPGSQLVVSTIS